MIDSQKVLRLPLNKKVFLLCLFFLSHVLEAARLGIEKFDEHNQRIFEFLADKMSIEDGVIKGEGNVSIISTTYYINSKQAFYDSTKRQIEFVGDVRVFKNESLYLEAQRVQLSLDDNHAILEPFYLQEASSGIWITAKSAATSPMGYELKDSTLSFCSVDMPVWELVFSEGEYNIEKSWLELWHARFAIFRYPIFYTPYVSFSLNNKRKSGFLYPTIKSSSQDGLVYNQPFYLAVNDRWDATFIGMLRTRRGYGGEVEFRYADDNNQILKINGGLFGVRDSYQKRYDLANNRYYGYQLQYTRYNLLKDYLYHFNEDGFYLDWANVNDIEYLRLREGGEGDVDIYDRLLTSRINYFLKGKNDYLGFYVKYYVDLSELNNDATLQTLPSIQYHSYVAPFLWDSVTYSFDYRINNYWRKVNRSMIQHEVTLPISYTRSLFDDYLSMKLSSTFYATRADYYYVKENLEAWNTDSAFYSNHYTLSLFSDLVKPYPNFLHTVHLEASYIVRGFRGRQGEFDTALVLPDTQEQIRLEASQYYHFSQSSPWVRHKIAQPIYIVSNSDVKYGDFEHELTWVLNESWTLSSSIFYSFLKQRVAETSHDVSYNSEALALYAGHFYRAPDTRYLNNTFDEATASFIYSGASKKFAYFDLFGSIGYDYKEKYFRMWNIGFQRDIRCFAYRLRLASETRPILTSGGIRPQDNQYVMFEVKFLPLVSIPYKYNTRGQ